MDGARSARRRPPCRRGARARSRAPHPERMRGPARTERGTGNSALVRRGVLLLGVLLELLALLLETVHQIRQPGTDERAPVITVRVVVRTRSEEHTSELQ